MTVPAALELLATGHLNLALTDGSQSCRPLSAVQQATQPIEF